MHKTWFYHHDLTTTEADDLIQRYTSRNVQTIKTLSADPRLWVVGALLPMGRKAPRASGTYQQKVWN